MQAIADLTTESLARAKGLSASYIRDAFSVFDGAIHNQRVVGIPYFGLDGSRSGTQVRLSDGSARWIDHRQVDAPYGINMLADVPRDRHVLLVEGTTDVWSGWTHDIPTVGVPGANAWKPEYARMLADRPVFIWEEPDAGGTALVVSIAPSLPQARVIRGNTTAKDLNDLHRQSGEAFQAILAQQISIAVPISARAARLMGSRSRHQYRRSSSGVTNVTGMTHNARNADLRRILADLGIIGVNIKRERAMIRCPFPDHNDTTPSFSLFRTSSGTWLFHCFGCGRKGDTISFVQQFRNVDFRTAIQELQ